MNSLASLLNVALTGIFALLKKYGKLPENYDVIIASATALIVQIVLVIVAQNPQLSDPLTLTLNIIIGIIGAFGATSSTPKDLTNQIKITTQSLRR